MTTLLQRGFSLLNRGMEAAASESVRYLRGPVVVSETLTATLSNQQIEQVTSGDSVVVGRQFTWHLKRSDFNIEGVSIEPERGDRIEWTYAGQTYVFIVLPQVGLPESNAVDPRSGWLSANVKFDGVQ